MDTLLLGLAPVAIAFNKQACWVLCILPIRTSRLSMGLPRATMHVPRLCPSPFQGASGTEPSVSGISQGLCITATLGSPLQSSISGTRILGGLHNAPCTYPHQEGSGMPCIRLLAAFGLLLAEYFYCQFNKKGDDHSEA